MLVCLVLRLTSDCFGQIVLGVHGSHMMDCIFMRPTPQSTVMEFFPLETYARDQEVAVQSIGLRYTAWWGSRLVYNSSRLYAIVVLTYFQIYDFRLPSSRSVR